ncbi:unnamed protein product [Moneuplotes crassus]|uniref:Uncharacterized protein n=1 Tax=Euplotes crassus TaxID=5936 RepID=A0AAD1Y7N5_EUPCR|nr:unnamed protein product [Moneuplotes crassus]
MSRNLPRNPNVHGARTNTSSTEHNCKISWKPPRLAKPSQWLLSLCHAVADRNGTARAMGDPSAIHSPRSRLQDSKRTELTPKSSLSTPTSKTTSRRVSAFSFRVLLLGFLTESSRECKGRQSVHVFVRQLQKSLLQEVELQPPHEDALQDQAVQVPGMRKRVHSEVQLQQAHEDTQSFLIPKISINFVLGLEISSCVAKKRHLTVNSRFRVHQLIIILVNLLRCRRSVRPGDFIDIFIYNSFLIKTKFACLRRKKRIFHTILYQSVCG